MNHLHHTFYIAAAFGLSSIILILNFWLPFRKHCQLIQQSKQNRDESAS